MIVGIVVDRNTSPSRPLEGVSITIRGTDRTFITSDDGVFWFDSLAPGTYDVRARRIGYEPKAFTVKIPHAGNAVFVLNPLNQTLAPIVSSAVAGGVGGYVSAPDRTPLGGVAVRIFGQASRQAVTDSSGQFHIAAPAGQYMMEVSGKGFRAELVSFNIPQDSGRLVAVTLFKGKNLGRDASARDNLHQRVVWRRFGSTIYTREDLVKLIGTSLTDLVRRAAQQPFNEDECPLMLNGHPIAWPMWLYYAEDLDMVEVYPPGTMGITSGRRVPMAPGRDRRGGAARVCPAVFIWQRK